MKAQKEVALRKTGRLLSKADIVGGLGCSPLSMQKRQRNILDLDARTLQGSCSGHHIASKKGSEKEVFRF